MPLHVSSTCAQHQEVKIALHSLWYHHTFPSITCWQFPHKTWPFSYPSILLLYAGYFSSPWHYVTLLSLSQCLTNLIPQNLLYNKFISCLYMFRAHVLIIRRSKLHYTASGIINHYPIIITYRCDGTRGCVMQFWPPDDEHICSKHVEAPIGDRLVHETATNRCNDTRGCVMQFWPPDDEHMCSKDASWNKTYCETHFVHQVG